MTEALQATAPLNRNSASTHAQPMFSFLQPEELSSVAACACKSIAATYVFLFFCLSCVLRAPSTASLFTPEHTGTPVGTEPKVRVFNKRKGGPQNCGKRRVRSRKPSRSSRLSVGENSLPAPTSQHIHVDCGGGGSGSPRTGPAYLPRIPFVPLWIKEP